MCGDGGLQTVRVHATRIPIRARQLAAALRMHRETAGLTLADIASALERSVSWVSRAETGQVRPRGTDVEVWARTCKAPKDRVATLARLARIAKVDDGGGWWDSYRAPVVADSLIDYAALEATAKIYTAIEPYLIPGLLQTADYAAALERGAQIDEREVDRLVEIRMRRQDRLTDDDPIRVWAVIGQEATERPIGGDRVLKAQIEHLIKRSELPHVTIQIMPRSVGAYPGMGGFTVLEFDQPGLEISYVDTAAGGLCVEDPTTVRDLMTTMRAALAAAMSPSESLDLLVSKIEESG